MLFSKFRRFMFWVWVLACVTSGVILLSYFKSFGEPAHVWAEWLITETISRYRTHKDLVDFFIGKLGILGAATWAIARWVIRTDVVLARLIADFIDRRISRFAASQTAMLEKILPTSLRSPVAAMKITVGDVDRALGGVRYVTSMDRVAAKQTITNSLNVAADQIKSATRRLSEIKSEKAGAHIVQSLLHISEATLHPEKSILAEEERNEAEKQLTEAVDVDVNQFEAWELRGLLRLQLGRLGPAIEDFNSMLGAAVRCSKYCVAARSQRHLAEIDRREETDAAARRAIGKINAALKPLTELAVRRQLSSAEAFEKAEAASRRQKLAHDDPDLN